MAAFYLCLYHIYFTLYDWSEGLRLRSWPRGVHKAKHAIHLVIKRFFLPEITLTVRARSGLSQGLWIRARFPSEASYWRGKRDGGVTERALVATVREGTVVYDVGAHIGIITFGAARLVGETGRVVAFEADPANVISLREGRLLNRFQDRIDIVEAAVWSHATSGIEFRRGASRRSHGGVVSGGHKPVLADGPVITVPATTLDDFAASSGLRPDVVKIDVEGGEYEVLQGAETLCARERPRLVIEVHHPEALKKISEWIRVRRYSAQWHVPGEGFPRILFAWPTESPLVL
jgi:FkbM family methyltransferase